MVQPDKYSWPWVLPITGWGGMLIFTTGKSAHRSHASVVKCKCFTLPSVSLVFNKGFSLIFWIRHRQTNTYINFKWNKVSFKLSIHRGVACHFFFLPHLICSSPLGFWSRGPREWNIWYGVREIVPLGYNSTSPACRKPWGESQVLLNTGCSGPCRS